MWSWKNNPKQNEVDRDQLEKHGNLVKNREILLGILPKKAKEYNVYNNEAN